MYTEHFPPYSYEKDLQITGLNTELVRRSCQIAKIQCEFRLLPWLRAYEAAQNDPKSGLYSTSRNPLREDAFQWVGPLAHASANMYWLTSRPDAPPRTLEQAKQYIVAVARGDVYELNPVLMRRPVHSSRQSSILLRLPVAMFMSCTCKVRALKLTSIYCVSIVNLTRCYLFYMARLIY